MTFNRYTILAAFFTLSIFAIVCYTSCIPCKCKGVVCVNGGTCAGCDMRTCTCPTGFTGASCEVNVMSQLKGTFTCRRSNCSPARDTVIAWQSTVRNDSVTPQISYVSNFDNTGNEATVSLSTNTSLVFTGNLAGYGVTVTGTFTNAEILVHYIKHPYQPGAPDTVCDITMVKM